MRELSKQEICYVDGSGPFSALVVGLSSLYAVSSLSRAVYNSAIMFGSTEESASQKANIVYNWGCIGALGATSAAYCCLSDTMTIIMSLGLMSVGFGVCCV